MRRYFMLPLFLLLAGCGTQVLTQGEPNFNTAILLPPPAPVLRSQPIRTRITLPGIRTRFN